MTIPLHRATERALLGPLTALGAVVLAACGDAVHPPPDPLATVVTIEVTPAADTVIALGQTRQLLATAKDREGNPVSGVPFTWTSSDEVVATVSESGLVAAAGNGGAVITAAAAAVSGTGHIMVQQARLAFLAQPGTADAQAPFNPAIRVAIQDTTGSTIERASLNVTLALDVNPGATLFGATSVRAVEGVATFADLSLDLPGDGFVLKALSAGLRPATSAGFDVRLRFVQISAADADTCGLTVPGFGYCWGWNADGRLGNDTAWVWRRPGPVTGGVRFATISTGGMHSCGMTTEGVAYCWGSNSYGQLGDGTTTRRSTPAPATGGLTFASVSAGSQHTCGVTTDGVAYCWGRNHFGQLGDSTGTDRLSPALVMGGARYSTVSAGRDHSCAVTANGDAYCWGRNQFGKLGDSTAVDRPSPARVSGGVSFETVIAGAYHSCGLVTNGAAYCWGSNGSGQLGNGNVGFGTDQSTPGIVAGGLAFRAITSGGYHTCAVTGDGAAYCWGNDVYGQLGDGDEWDQIDPHPVAGGLTFSAIDAGWTHTCGMTAEGAVYCWGSGGNGELGNGAEINQSRVPVRVVQ